MRRRYLRRAGDDAKTRELILIAADLFSAPHPNESHTLRQEVISRAEEKLVPHATLLRWYLYKNWLWKLAPLVLVIFHVVLFIFTARGIKSIFFSRATFESISFVKPETAEKNNSRAAETEISATEINTAKKIASLTRIAAFVKGELPHNLGATRETLSSSEQLSRDVLAAAILALDPDSEMMNRAADAMRENHLGIAWSIIAGVLRECRIDPHQIASQKITLAPSLSLIEASEQITLTLLDANAKDALFQTESTRTRGGNDQNNLEISKKLENDFSRTINSSRKSAWGELPTLRETLRAHSEIPLLPPEYWSSVREFLQRE